MTKLHLKIFPPHKHVKIRKRVANNRPYDKNRRDDSRIAAANRLLNSRSRGNTSSELVSSVHGKLELLVFHYNEIDEIAKNTNWQTTIGLHTVIAQLGTVMPNVMFLIVTEKAKQSTIKLLKDYLDAYINGQYEIIPAFKRTTDSDAKFGPWARDTYLALYDNEKDTVALIEPRKLINRSGINDLKVLDSFVKHDNAQKRNVVKGKPLAALDYDGGNFLIGDNFMFVGQDIYEANKIIKRVEEVIHKGLKDCRSLFFLKASPPNDIQRINTKTSDGFYNSFASRGKTDARGLHQPMFHLDYFMSLAGRDALGAYQVVVGKPIVGLSEEEQRTLPDDVVQLCRIQVERMDKSIEEVIKYLQSEDVQCKQQFRVVRVPLPLTYHDELIEGTKTLLYRKWYWATYNNCIVEIYNDRRIVWLPSYADNYNHLHLDEEKRQKWIHTLNNIPLRPTINEDTQLVYGNWDTSLSKHEKAVETIWKYCLGFDEINFIRADLHHYIQSKGSIACLTNCIKRIAENNKEDAENL